MKKEKYIANGKIFYSYGEVIEYAKENNLRVSNTQTIKKHTYLITLNLIK